MAIGPLLQLVVERHPKVVKQLHADTRHETERAASASRREAAPVGLRVVKDNRRRIIQKGITHACAREERDVPPAPEVVIRHSHHVPAPELQLPGMVRLAVENRTPDLHADIQRKELHVIPRLGIKGGAGVAPVEIQPVGPEREASADFPLEPAHRTRTPRICRRAVLGIALHETEQQQGPCEDSLFHPCCKQ